MCVSLDGKLSFRYFDGIAALSVDCRCHLTAARGTGNFGQYIALSGNRCKFTSVLICTSLAHPCASVAGFQAKFQVPLAVVIRHLHFDEPYSDFVKHWKDSFYNQKRNTHIRNSVFLYLKQRSSIPEVFREQRILVRSIPCLLYTSDAADEL